LICSRNGSAALIGKSAVIPESLAGSTWGTFMTVLRSPMNPFLKWVLRTSIFSQQVGLFATSTINQLTSSMLHNFEIPVPPPAEQAAIANYLDHSVNEIDELIREANLFIELSKEYRQALITAAIAGQLDFTRSAD
jgi:type I restriction enzyme S subunit